MEINWLAVVAALVVGMVVAAVWYGKVFVALWWRLTGITPEQSKQASRRNMVQLLVANAVTAVALAVGTAVASEAFADDGVRPALGVAVVAWLGFSATTLVQHNAFELKKVRLTVLNCAYQLVLFVAMGAVIGAL